MRAALIALFLVAAPAAAGPAEVAVPVDCGKAVCVLPKDVWLAVMGAHNAMVEEIAQLKAAAARGSKPRACPGDREV